MRFGTIAADPPWQFRDRLAKMRAETRRGADSHYPTLTVEELCRLPVRDLAREPSVLALWCPGTFLRSGFEVMDAWGFSYRQEWTWVKMSRAAQCVLPSGQGLAFGMGRLARGADEHVLVGTRAADDSPDDYGQEYALVGVRGSLYRELASRSERTVIIDNEIGHSSKTEKLQAQLERMFPSHRRLELFARRERPGWECVGDESPSTLGEDIRRSIARLIGRPEP